MFTAKLAEDAPRTESAEDRKKKLLKIRKKMHMRLSFKIKSNVFKKLHAGSIMLIESKRFGSGDKSYRRQIRLGVT